MKHGKDFMIIPFFRLLIFIVSKHSKNEIQFISIPSSSVMRIEGSKNDIIIIKNETQDVWIFEWISIKISNNINSRNNYSSLRRSSGEHT